MSTTITQHLIELRKRLVHSLILLTVLVVVLFPFANPLYTLLADPLLTHLPPYSEMIATQVAAPVFVPLKLVVLIAVLLAIPYLLYQIWAFVAPGLYKNERRWLTPLLWGSSGLFYSGVAFAYFVVMPLIMQFFIFSAPEGVTVMTDMSAYFDFVMQLFLAFGATFEVPLIVFLLIHSGLVTREFFTKQRPYFIIGAFVIGMLLTPPDVFSQILLAVPLCILFELGLLFAKWWPAQTSAKSD
jgi:sec-independent protein translocase protein TatC